MSQKQELILYTIYEDIEKAIGRDAARLLRMIVPVVQAEHQLIQVLHDIRTSGNLVFIRGVSGSGKSTFLSYIAIQNRLPIRQVVEVRVSELPLDPRQHSKLKVLYKRLREVCNEQAKLPPSDKKTCVVISYLENLHDETESDIRAFFRDLNPLLRHTPILILWQVTDLNDAQNMQALAQSVASTLFNRKLPIMYFTGPDPKDYSTIVKNTISVLNDGHNITEFGLTDTDLDAARQQVEELPYVDQTVRRYLEIIRDLWEVRTNYIQQVVRQIRLPTEIWFMVCYSGAEAKIGSFSTKSTGTKEDNWRANYAKLNEYLKNTQKAAQWKDNRLALALAAFHTKIMYLPTNSFINALAAYGIDIDGFPITRSTFRSWGDQDNWFHKSKARITLARSPLMRQLLNLEAHTGERPKGRNVSQAVNDAKLPFENISKGISEGQWSDRHLNRALCLAVQDTYAHPPPQVPLPDGFVPPKLEFKAETKHPYLNVIPDILIEVPNSKLICLEMYYTTKTQDSDFAYYCLNKLDNYMDQWELFSDSGRSYLF